jgi:hypothetical protein
MTDVTARCVSSPAPVKTPAIPPRSPILPLRMADRYAAGRPRPIAVSLEARLVGSARGIGQSQGLHQLVGPAG